MVRLPLPYSKLLGFSHRTLLAEWEKPPSFKPVAGTTKIHRACERRTGHDRRNAPKGRCHGRRDSRRGALLGLDSQQGRRRARVLGALRDAGVNLIAFWRYKHGPGRAQLEFIPEDGVTFVAAAKQARLKLRNVRCLEALRYRQSLCRRRRQ